MLGVAEEMPPGKVLQSLKVSPSIRAHGCIPTPSRRRPLPAPGAGRRLESAHRRPAGRDPAGPSKRRHHRAEAPGLGLGGDQVLRLHAQLGRQLAS